MNEAAKKENSKPAPETNAVHELQAEVNRLESQVRESKERYLYLYADLENVKKRAQTEKDQAILYCSEYFAKDLLEVIDNLERSLDHLSADAQPGIVQGLTLTLNHFKSILEKHGIKPISSEGQAFDPHIHEAIGQLASEEPPGTILYEERKGYLYHDRLLRPARVMISSGQNKE